MGWKLVVPPYCGACSLCVGLDQWLVKVSWLGELESVFWWVELHLFSLSAMKRPVVCFGVSIGLAWLWAACLLMLIIVFLLCWRINMVCLALEFVDSWVEFDFRVDMEALG